MSGSEKDQLAALVIDQHCALQQALAGTRKRYPTREFKFFAAMMRQYVDATREDEMLHRGVVRAVNVLVEY
jgi:hypothetical protein